MKTVCSRLKRISCDKNLGELKLLGNSTVVFTSLFLYTAVLNWGYHHFLKADQNCKVRMLSKLVSTIFGDACAGEAGAKSMSFEKWLNMWV